MVYVFLANGFEEMEALAPVDLLRRAGVEVFTVGVGSDMIVSSHNIPVKTDTTVDKIVLNDELEMIVLPGGMPGTLNLEASPDVLGAVDYCADNNRLTADMQLVFRVMRKILKVRYILPDLWLLTVSSSLQRAQAAA